MKKHLYVVGGLLVAVVVLLMTLRVTGFNAGPTTSGLWLRGEIATEPINDWTFVMKDRGLTGIQRGVPVQGERGSARHDRSAGEPRRSSRKSSSPKNPRARTVPIYEYECRGCQHRFEFFLRPSSSETPAPPACPSCQSLDLERLRSAFAVNSEGTRQSHLQQARKANMPVTRDKKMAEVETAKRIEAEHLDH